LKEKSDKECAPSKAKVEATQQFNKRTEAGARQPCQEAARERFYREAERPAALSSDQDRPSTRCEKKGKSPKELPCVAVTK